MSTLKVNKLRDTAGSADAITLDPNGGAVLAGVTTVTSVKVGAAVTISESGIEASGIGITCANINGTQIGGRRNIIINGAMLVAQRATSTSGGASGYVVHDRFSYSASNLANNADISQATISSGDAYDSGFRKSLKVTNGDNNADSDDQSKINHIIESSDLANSGWDSVNSNSKVTLSFWVKSSVAQTFVVHLYADDANDSYAFEYSATTSWTKIVHTIPGASGLTINNDNGAGINIQWYLYMGTDRTNNSFTYNAWGGYDSNARARDMTTTWQTTNDATFELTGVQLEVGPQATPFEHRSVAEELLLCQRYYFKLGKLDYISQHMGANAVYGIGMSDNDNSSIYGMINFPVRMRTAPTAIDQSGSAADYRVRRDTTKACSGVPTFVEAAEHYCRVNFPSASHGWGTGQMLWCMSAGSSGYLGFEAEL